MSPPVASRLILAKFFQPLLVELALLDLVLVWVMMLEEAVVVGLLFICPTVVQFHVVLPR